MSKRFGKRLRELRRAKGATLRELAETVGVDFTYLSKIENGKAGYVPRAETIRALAAALEAEALELLELADKVPPEIQHFTTSAPARRFFALSEEIVSPDDWEALLDLLEQRQKNRGPDEIEVQHERRHFAGKSVRG